MSKKLGFPGAEMPHRLQPFLEDRKVQPGKLAAQGVGSGGGSEHG
jgi:hypothetical protein